MPFGIISAFGPFQAFRAFKKKYQIFKLLIFARAFSLKSFKLVIPYFFHLG